MKYLEQKSNHHFNSDYLELWNIATRGIGAVLKENPELQNSQTPEMRVAQVVGTSFALDVRRSQQPNVIER